MQGSKGLTQEKMLLQDKKIQLDEITVSAQRVPQIYSKVSRVVTIITREEINSAPVQSIQELLEYVTGCDIRQRGSLGVQADISIRGGSFDQVLVLLNGICISDPQTGHFNLDIPVDIESIERIEILSGPASRIFGVNAFSGAINIITGNKNSRQLRLSGLYGQHGLYKVALSSNLLTGSLNNYFSVSNSGSDGYIDNTDFNFINLFYQGKISLNKSEFEFQLGRSNKKFGANSFYTPKYPNQFEATRTSFSSLKFTTGKVIKFTQSVYWRRHNDRFELFREEPAPWYSGHNYHRTDVAGANLSVIIASILGKTSVGLDFKSENILSNVLGEDLGKIINVAGEPEGYFNKGYLRNNLSVYLEHNVMINKLAISGGIMTNWNSDLSSKASFFPGMDLSYEVLPGLRIYSTINKSLRLPTFTDLFYSGPTNIGNPDLKPEEAVSVEGGLKFQKTFLRGSVSVFNRSGKNVIDWVKDSEEDKWQSRNLTSVNASGFELKTKIFPAILSNADFPVNYLSFSYSNINMTKSSQGLISRYILDYLKHKITVETKITLFKNTGLNWRIIYQDRAGGYISFDNGIFGEELPYRPFWISDLKFFYNYKKHKIYLEISNLFNVEYQDLGNLLQPGRWIRLGLSIDFLTR